MKQNPSKKMTVTFTIAALAVLILSAVMYMALNRNTIYQGVKVSGIDVSGLSKDEAVKLISQKLKSSIGNKKLSVLSGANKKEIPLSDEMYNVNVISAADKAWKYAREGNPINRLSAIIKAASISVNIPTEIDLNKNKVKKHLTDLKSDLDKKPENAYITFENGKPSVVKEKLGYKINTEKLLGNVEKSLSENDEKIIKLEADKLKPDIKSDMLTMVTKKMAEFQTVFVNTNKQRNNNMIMACRRINETLLMPGDVFSMNKAIGPRTLSNGFKEAKIIINNELVDGVGGGVCQVTSTLYNVVLLSRLQVVERSPHSIPLLYVPPGRDATISEDDLDFRFRNNRSFPVSINAEVHGNTIRIAIFGKDDNDGSYVKLESIKSQIMEPDFEELIFDGSLYKGTRKIVQKAVNGYRAQVYRSLYSKEGKLIKKEKISDNIYNPIRAKIKIGIK